MDNKIKLFAMTSVVAVMISGCSGYNNQDNTAGSNGSASNGGSQNSGSGQVSNNRNTCVPCAAKKPAYVYKPRPRTVTKPRPRTVAKPRARTTYRAPAPRPAGQHNQQYYVDRWNRQQNQSRNKTTATRATNNTGYGNGYYTAPNTASSTTYYDYSSAGRKKNTNTASLSTTNKSIYTGSYQKRTYKPYKPTTYAGGGTSTTYQAPTYKAATYTGGTRSSGNGSTYVVKKGDTVFEIMRQTGVYWKDIIRLNNLQKPYNINPGQTVRLK